MEQQPRPWQIWEVRYAQGTYVKPKMMMIIEPEKGAFGAWFVCGFLINTDKRTDYLGEPSTEICDVLLPKVLHIAALTKNSFLNCGFYHRCPYSDIRVQLGVIHKTIRPQIIQAIEVCEVLKPIQKKAFLRALCPIVSAEGNEAD